MIELVLVLVLALPLALVLALALVFPPWMLLLLLLPRLVLLLVERFSTPARSVRKRGQIARAGGGARLETLYFCRSS